MGLAVGLVVAACGSSSSTSNSNPLIPGGNGAGNNGNNGGGSSSLTSGLESNLDKLDSYQFSESIFSSSTGLAASPGDSGSFLITGTVINKGTKSISLNYPGMMQYIVVGTEAWNSFDGSTWYAADPTSASFTDLLPGHLYGNWFDTNSTGFKVQGDETKNGIPCVHFKGDSSLSALYSSIAGVSANFQADLWVAKDGNYPVSGIYGFSGSSGGQGGSFGYSFDVTHVNDATNQVTAPTNVVALPS
jgi:hypothetical protein